MTRKNEIAVGIMFFTAMAILGYFTIIKGSIFDTKEYYTMTVKIENVEGLENGDKVLVNGVLGGSVSDIRLAPRGVMVTLKMYLRFILYENYSIRIKNKSALGGRFISIYPGSSEENGEPQIIIETRKNLTGRSTGDPIDLLAELIAENSDNVSETIKNIRDFTVKMNSGQFFKSLDNLRDITEQIKKGRGTIGKLIKDNELHSDTADLIKEVRETVEDAREQAPITSFLRAALTAF